MKIFKKYSSFLPYLLLFSLLLLFWNETSRVVSALLIAASFIISLCLSYSPGSQQKKKTEITKVPKQKTMVL
ncbi:hypothetical protein CHISP_2986 [Chitinispirillum alkaliphilum]|nr:hypothetical protein CHISP_2986 [Chitinispirillum alkaliphilum]